MDFALVPLLTDALIASGHPEQIQSTLAGWEMRLDQSMRPILSAMMRAVALYQQGKLEEFTRLCEANALLRGNGYRLHSLLALGRAAEAAEIPRLNSSGRTPGTRWRWAWGSCSTARKKEAAKWRERVPRPARLIDHRLSPRGPPPPGCRSPSGRRLRSH